MAGDVYPHFRAAAVQAAPVFLDREATISRLADWVAKARDVGVFFSSPSTSSCSEDTIRGFMP
jgi:hypothetical protein